METTLIELPLTELAVGYSVTAITLIDFSGLQEVQDASWEFTRVDIC